MFRKHKEQTRLLRGGLALLLVSALAACASVRVSTDFDPEIDFAAYRTFAWLPEPTGRTGNPRLDSPLLADRIRSAVERELSAKSFRKVAAGMADFHVGYHLSLEKGIDVRTVDQRYGYGPGWPGSGPSHTYVSEYEQGTLILDFVDAGANRLAWRGSGSRRIPRQTTPEQTTENVNMAVTEILASFPPGEQAPR
ncbi:MAG: DUF4136 domain-containing protein [bacterium]|nr:DUF4136 domain-containing protein [bacterium]